MVELLDDLKILGFKYATDLGFSFSMEDCKVDFDLKSRIKKWIERRTTSGQLFTRFNN